MDKLNSEEQANFDRLYKEMKSAAKNMGTVSRKAINNLAELPTREDIEEYSIGGFDPIDVMPGPGYKASTEKLLEIITDGRLRNRMGEFPNYWIDIQDKILKEDPRGHNDSRLINFALPYIMTCEKYGMYRTSVVFVSDPEDTQRISKNHVKKMPKMTAMFMGSVISTTDNEVWKKQRNHLNEVFLPKKSLAKIFPKSLSRAKKCVDIMAELAQNSRANGVEINDFYLHETQAQLQLGLFGMDENFMEQTNRELRNGFSQINPDPEAVTKITLSMMSKVADSEGNFAVPSDPNVMNGNQAVKGPLSKSVADAGDALNLSARDQFGNMLIILFAGHDTTGHTMTWLTYELAKHPEYQKRLHDEVDQFYKMLNGRDMTYEDCEHLPFMSRCITETLRLWNPVPQGSFRELQFDDYVKGFGGEEVLLKKGTYIIFDQYGKHHSKLLWGDDCMEFNPDRNFRDDEIWGGESFRAFNPSSGRYHPFQYAPRDCLGKNFAHMEMRTILANIFHRFKFELSEPYKNIDPRKLMNTLSTMGPRDVTPEGLKQTKINLNKKQIGGKFGSGFPVGGMWLHVHPRKLKANL